MVISAVSQRFNDPVDVRFLGDADLGFLGPSQNVQ